MLQNDVQVIPQNWLPTSTVADGCTCQGRVRLQKVISPENLSLWCSMPDPLNTSGLYAASNHNQNQMECTYM